MYTAYKSLVTSQDEILEETQEKTKRRKRVYVRKPKNSTGKAFLLLFAGIMLPVIGLGLCVYYLWDAFRVQYLTGETQAAIIWFALVTLISGLVNMALLINFFGA